MDSSPVETSRGDASYCVPAHARACVIRRKPSIKVGGQDIREVTQASLRRSVGVVPQDTVLFNDTIGYNIAYGNLSASEEEVQEAVRNAQLDSSIQMMPEVGHARL